MKTIITVFIATLALTLLSMSCLPRHSNPEPQAPVDEESDVEVCECRPYKPHRTLIMPEEAAHGSPQGI